MEIKIRDFKIEDEWDIQRAYLILQLDEIIIGGLLSQEIKEEYKRKITEFLWENVKNHFPKIEKFLTDEKGGFNKAYEKYYNTPIINIDGIFFMQLIGSDKNGKLIWEAVKLEPYGFFFNSGKYFIDMVIDAVNRLIIRGSKMEDFKELIYALNETTVEDDWTRITIKEKDVRKVFMVEGEREKLIW
ncbi:MAG: hypothetical protein QW734_03650 [Candidatus Bathyarchaeia archaeon]